ncbi:MAG: flavodoxin-dependent (E)-4-hydroxy-3-methylbut-2-enyl-diphosphate synthase, partial [Eubacterium sp.]|nr:flavodoxin-dependent (E)-4-hydroxy-3-methylbut-2-enyl-diphosphate synthase [Eubacterium sp.]
MDKRNETRTITVRKVKIGGDAPVTVQSMCNTKTWDVEATLDQIRAFQAAGCDIVRLAVPDVRSAEALEKIR